jgi:hypothetical protein
MMKEKYIASVIGVTFSNSPVDGLDCTVKAILVPRIQNPKWGVRDTRGMEEDEKHPWALVELEGGSVIGRFKSEDKAWVIANRHNTVIGNMTAKSDL